MEARERVVKMGALKHHSIVRRILTLVVSMVILIALVNSAVINTMIYRQLLTEYKSKGIAISQSIADSASDILLFRDPATIQSLLDQHLTINGVAYLVLEDAENNIVAHTFVPQVPQALRTIYAGKRTTTATTAFHRLPGLGNVYEISQPILFGEIGIIHVGMSLKPIHHSMLKVVAILIPILLVVLITALFVFRSRLRFVTRPLVELADYTKHLAGHNFEQSLPEQGAIRAIAAEHNDEVGRLSETIVSLEDAIMTYIGDLKRTTAAKQKIESELMIARQIQLGMLPKSTDNTAFETVKIASYLEPAREVGGDFFDFINVGEDVYIVAGDVSGKGVSAAIFMATTMMLIKAKAQEHIPPQELMVSVNNQLIALNENMLFVTVFCGKINRYTGIFSYVNAGHPAPFIKRKNEALEIPLTGGMALGVDYHHYYQQRELQLENNDTICLYTDGISEAMDVAQNQYTEARLAQCIGQSKAVSAHELMDDILQDVRIFSDGADQSDDITVLLASWCHASASVSSELGVHFTNDLSEIAKLHQVVDIYSQANGLTKTLQHNLKLVLEELIANTISYGYRDHEIHDIKVFFTVVNNALNMRIEDDGIPFNPLEDAPEVDHSLSLEDMPVGGLGIHIVKNFVDTIHYERQDHLNVVEFTKSLGETA